MKAGLFSLSSAVGRAMQLRTTAGVRTGRSANSNRHCEQSEANPGRGALDRPELLRRAGAPRNDSVPIWSIPALNLAFLLQHAHSVSQRLYRVFEFGLAMGCRDDAAGAAAEVDPGGHHRQPEFVNQ